MINLGMVQPGCTIYVPFETFSGTTGAPITMSGFAAGDIKIYKDGSTTERASTSGYTLLDADGTDFDSITGIQGFSVDLSDNTTADFYQNGSTYFVVVTGITVDSQSLSFVAAYFRIGYEHAMLNTFIATLSSQTSFTLNNGPAEDNALKGMQVIVHDTASAVQRSMGIVSAYTGSSKTVTLSVAPTFTIAAKDSFSALCYAPLQPATPGRNVVVDSNGLADANVVKLGPTGSGTAQTARDIGSSVVAASVTGNVGGNVLGSVGSVTNPVSVTSSIKKNQALSGFTFVMIDSADHVSGKTGLTVTAARSLDGSAFASCANSVSEIGSGAYKLDLAAADLNGNSVLLKFSATGADTRFVEIVTQP